MLKTVVISVLILGCFLMMGNVVPSLLTSTRPDNRKLSNDQLIKMVTTLIGMLVVLTLVLHYWR